MFKLHDRVFVKLVRPGEFVSAELAGSVVAHSGGLACLVGRLELRSSPRTLPDSLLSLLIVMDYVARGWMVSGTGIELHVKLSLHLFVLLFSDFRCVIFLFIFTEERLVGLA